MAQWADSVQSGLPIWNNGHDLAGCFPNAPFYVVFTFLLRTHKSHEECSQQAHSLVPPIKGIISPTLCFLKDLPSQILENLFHGA